MEAFIADFRTLREGRLDDVTHDLVSASTPAR